MSRQLNAWISIFFALVGGTIAAEGLSMWQESVAGSPSNPAFYAESYQPPEVIALSSEASERTSPN